MTVGTALLKRLDELRFPVMKSFDEVWEIHWERSKFVSPKAQAAVLGGVLRVIPRRRRRGEQTHLQPLSAPDAIREIDRIGIFTV